MNLCDAGKGIPNLFIWKQSVLTLDTPTKDQSSVPDRELVCAGKCSWGLNPHTPATGLLGTACLSVQPFKAAAVKLAHPGKIHSIQKQMLIKEDLALFNDCLYAKRKIVKR